MKLKLLDPGLAQLLDPGLAQELYDFAQWLSAYGIAHAQDAEAECRLVHFREQLFQFGADQPPFDDPQLTGSENARIVLDLDKDATAAPWNWNWDPVESAWYLSSGWKRKKGVGRVTVGPEVQVKYRMSLADSNLITRYRSLAPKLALEVVELRRILNLVLGALHSSDKKG